MSCFLVLLRILGIQGSSVQTYHIFLTKKSNDLCLESSSCGKLIAYSRILFHIQSFLILRKFFIYLRQNLSFPVTSTNRSHYWPDARRDEVTILIFSKGFNFYLQVSGNSCDTQLTYTACLVIMCQVLFKVFCKFEQNQKRMCIFYFSDAEFSC